MKYLLLIAYWTYLVVLVLMGGHAHAQGTWVLSDGSTAVVPCPSPETQADETMTVRLPSGCKVTHPRIGYTISQDLRLRDEVVDLRAKRALLTEEVAQGRTFADAQTAAHQKALAAERKEADAQRAGRQDAEMLAAGLENQLGEAQEEKKSATLWSGALGLLIGAVIGLLL